MAKGMQCESCGQFFLPDQGYAIAVMLAERTGAPYFEAPQYQEACSAKCAATLATKTAKLRSQEHADAQAHRLQAEKEGKVKQAQDAADYAKVLESARMERFRHLAQEEVGRIAPAPGD